jgi:hypothetical protein
MKEGYNFYRGWIFGVCKGNMILVDGWWYKVLPKTIHDVNTPRPGIEI